MAQCQCRLSWPVAPGPKITVTDWATAITIILTALGAVLAALAIMLGVVAFWGYTKIKEIEEESKQIAERVATAKASEVATTIAYEAMDRTLATAQAGNLSAAQVEDAAKPETPTAEEAAKDATARPVTADKALGKEDSK